jgi:hypothetical protein
MPAATGMALPTFEQFFIVAELRSSTTLFKLVFFVAKLSQNDSNNAW